MYFIWIILFSLGVPILIGTTLIWGISRGMREQGIPRRWVVLLWIVGPILLSLLPASLNILSNIKFYSAKQGRIVDATTGNGMPNVVVISVGTFFGENLVHGSTYATLYRTIARTDADGNYRLPSHWGEVVWWFPPIPGTSPQLRWIVTVFQPGYVIAGDDEGMDFYEHREGAMDPNSVYRSPSATWLGIFTRVEPIQVHPAQLSLKQAARYSQRIIAAGESPNSRNDPADLMLRKLGNEMFLPKVCTLNPDEAMDGDTVSALTVFGDSRAASLKKLEELEPSGFQDAYKHPIFHAKNVCEAMKSGG